MESLESLGRKKGRFRNFFPDFLDSLDFPDFLDFLDFPDFPDFLDFPHSLIPVEAEVRVLLNVLA